MASIRYNGEFLELYKDERISLERRSAWLMDELRDELSYPFKLPWMRSAINRRILEHLHLPQAIVQRSRIPILLDIQGRQRLAEMVLRQAGEDLTVNIYIIASQLTVLEKNLPELSIPNSKSIKQLYEDGITKSWPATACYFPMLVNPYLYDEQETLEDPDTDPSDLLNKNFEGIINAWKPGTLTYRENYVQNSENFNVNTLIPCVALMEVLSQALAEDNYALVGRWYEHPSWRKAFLFNNRTLDQQFNRNARLTGTSYKLTIKAGQTITIPFTSGEGPGSNVVNDQYVVNTDENFRAEFWAQARNMSSSDAGFPGILEAYFFYDNGQQANLTFPFNGADGSAVSLKHLYQFSTADIGKNIRVHIWNPTTVDIYVEFEYPQFDMRLDGDTLVEFQAPDDLSEHLPEISVAELLNRLMTDLNLGIVTDYDAKTIELIDRNRSQLAPRTPDLLPYQVGDMEVNYGEKKELIIRHEAPNDYEENRYDPYDKLLRINKQGEVFILKEMPSGYQDDVLDLKIHPLMRTYYFNGNYSNHRWLSFREQGISRVLDTNADMISVLRLGFYDRVNNEPLGLNALEEASLRLDLVPGTIGNALATWHNFRQADPRTFQVTLRLPWRMSAELDENKVAVIAGVAYLMKEISYEDAEGLDEIPVKLKLLPI